MGKKIAKKAIFERRVFIMSYIVKSKHPVSNVELQNAFDLDRTQLNPDLVSFRAWGWLDYEKKGCAYFYKATDLAKSIFKE